MYNGYRLKIDGVILPNSMIAKGSYSAKDDARVVETWTDGYLVEHQIISDNRKARIRFSMIEHDSTNHADFIAYLQKNDDISVEFYNDRTDSYRTANCRLSPLQFSGRSSYGGKLQYNKTAIEFIEN